MQMLTLETASCPFWDSNWFSALVTSVAALLVGLGAVYLDHRKQRKVKKVEELRKFLDMELYFYQTCEDLIAAVGEQITVYKGLLEQLKSRKHGEYFKKSIPWMNLERVYYLTPKETFQIFVLNRKESSQENSKRILNIYKQFDRISQVKKLEVDHWKVINDKIESRIERFWTGTIGLESNYRKIRRQVFEDPELARHIQFFIEAQKIFNEFGKLANRANIDITKTELLDKLLAELAKGDYTAFIFREELIDWIYTANRGLAECVIQEKLLATVVQDYIDALSKATDAISTELQLLKNGSTMVG
jgi:hypothetical protein